MKKNKKPEGWPWSLTKGLFVELELVTGKEFPTIVTFLLDRPPGGKSQPVLPQQHWRRGPAVPPASVGAPQLCPLLPSFGLSAGWITCCMCCRRNGPGLKHKLGELKVCQLSLQKCKRTKKVSSPRRYCRDLQQTTKTNHPHPRVTG